jgi:hypothetical protein
VGSEDPIKHHRNTLPRTLFVQSSTRFDLVGRRRSSRSRRQKTENRRQKREETRQKAEGTRHKAEEEEEGRGRGRGRGVRRGGRRKEEEEKKKLCHPRCPKHGKAHKNDSRRHPK